VPENRRCYAGTNIPHRAISLSRDEERELIRAAKSGDKRAEEEVIVAHMPLLYAIVQRWNTKGRIGLADLVSAGLLGLKKALDGFDPSLGYRFSTYARYVILEEVKTLFTKERHVVTRGTAPNARLVGKILAHERRRDPSFNIASIEEARRLCEKYQLSMRSQTFLHYAESQQWAEVSLDHPATAPRTAGAGATLGDLLPCERGNAESFLEQQQQESERVRILEAALSRLNQREAVFISPGYDHDDDAERMTLEELGRRYGVTKERVRQLEHRALEIMRRHLIFQKQELELENAW
jgi:RNA polymerase sigma-32 factor